MMTFGSKIPFTSQTVRSIDRRLHGPSKMTTEREKNTGSIERVHADASATAASTSVFCDRHMPGTAGLILEVNVEVKKPSDMSGECVSEEHPRVGATLP